MRLAFCARLWLLALLVVSWVWQRAAAGEGETPIERAAQIRVLSPESVVRSLPVRLSGVITYAEPEAGLAFLQDDTAGLMLTSVSQSFRQLKPGMKVRIEGRTAPGSFAPLVSVTNAAGMQVEGSAPFPTPRRLGIEELQHGVYDAQWIEMRGVVRLVEVRPFSSAPLVGPGDATDSCLRLRIEISTAQGRYTAIVPWEAGKPAPKGLADSAVRIEGVLGSIVNTRGQWVGLLIYVPSLDQVHVERPPVRDRFAAPQKSVSELLRFTPEQTREERVRITGTVLLTYGDYIGFLRTRDGTIEIRGALEKKLRRGDRVEAAGYPTLQNKRVYLDDCVVRAVGNQEVVEPIRAGVMDSLESDLHGELVEIHGTLVQNTKRSGDLLLILNCDGQSVEATLPVVRLEAEAEHITQLQPGSLLKLTGVSQVLTSMQWSGFVRPYEFRLLLGSPSDIRLLRAPPWWTPGQLLGLVGALVAVLGLVVVWVVLLRRQVARQTEVIKDKVEREAVWRDRSRIAQDIHDDLGASLTQVGFLSQRVQAARQQPEEAVAMADRIAELARASIRALDEIVWAVNPRHDSLQSLADYLVKLAGEQLALTNINCLLEIPTVLPDIGLRAELRHNVALAVKEALHNVVKHSRARTATISLRFEAWWLEITIRDDGIGFRPAEKNGRRSGLANIERRLQEIGGSCVLETGPGQGTVVKLTASVQPFKARTES